MSQGKQPDGKKEQFWRQMMRRQRESHLPVRAFCELHELSEASWYYWRRVLAQRDGQRVQFTPVDIVAPAAANSDTDASAGLELLLVNGRRIRVGVDFDAATLQRLLAVLEDQPC